MRPTRLVFSIMRGGRSYGGYHRSHSNRRAAQFTSEQFSQNYSSAPNNNNNDISNNNNNNNNNYNDYNYNNNHHHGGGGGGGGPRNQHNRRQQPHRQQYHEPPPPAPDPLELYKFDDVTPNDVKALDIFPQVVDDLLLPGKAVCYLTQIVTVAENQYKNVGGIHFDTKAISGFWVGFLTINYPERRTFTCKHRNKKECKNLCSLAAVYNLRKNNNVDSRLKLNIDTSVANHFVDNSRSPIQLIPIPMSMKQQMMSFISKFDDVVYNLIEYRIDNVRSRYERMDTGGLEGKHSAILEGLEPDEGIVASESATDTSQESLPANSGPVDIFNSRIYTPPDINRKYQAFSQLKKVFSNKERKYQDDHHYYEVIQAQERLPIRSLKDTILTKLQDHRAIVVAGDTGCGKSTQVPQFILEHFISDDHNANSFANIAITQPRRISAISLAERVAMELGESSSGYTVGHNVRFDSRPTCRDLNIMTFFTTGMLLRKLQRNSDLRGVTHLVIDEVHERDCTTDFLLILIKRLLTRRKDLRVIFMSASMDASLFARYFDNCPIVTVPGRCYPVGDLYLDNISNEMRLRSLPRDEVREFGRAPKLDVNFLTDLIAYIDSSRDQGAILCFMPGWKEMKAMQKELEMVRTQNRLKVLLVHSKLPISEQRLIFSRCEPHERKVILATNIAETSLTINDVCYVIDTGLCNSIDYDPELNMSTFGTRWISRANAKQRSGRAGRTCPGECFKLYTRDEESKFQDYPFPELLRIPLESVIMEAKSHCPNESAVNFLSQAIQHPSISAIHNALEELMLLGVLDGKENLTVLGKRISDFPTHPRLSVSLVVASALRCLYPILNASAILSSTQEPFLTALTDKSQIRATKERLCNEATGDGREPLYFMSDHIAFGNLLAQYDNAAMSKHELDFFMQENNLNRSAMINIQDCRNLYARMMIASKFVNTYEWYSFDSLPNRNMNELELVIASMAYSFYPKVVRVIKGLLKGGRMYPNKVAPTDTQSNNRVRFASDSIVKNISLGKQLNSTIRDDSMMSSGRGGGGGGQAGGDVSDEDSDYLSMIDLAEDKRPNLLVYLNSRVDQDSGQIVVRDGSVVPPLTLLLFGGRDLQVHEQPTAPGAGGGGGRPRGAGATNIDSMDGGYVNITMDRHNLLTFRVQRDDAQVIQAWRRVWHQYFDWFIHTKNTCLSVDENDSIIAGTMNNFLDLNKKLYQAIR